MMSLSIDGNRQLAFCLNRQSFRKRKSAFQSGRRDHFEEATHYRRDQPAQGIQSI